MLKILFPNTIAYRYIAFISFNTSKINFVLRNHNNFRIRVTSSITSWCGSTCTRAILMFHLVLVSIYCNFCHSLLLDLLWNIPILRMSEQRFLLHKSRICRSKSDFISLAYWFRRVNLFPQRTKLVWINVEEVKRRIKLCKSISHLFSISINYICRILPT